ncbi:uncharacterized protein, partial [Littorina saxatilis]
NMTLVALALHLVALLLCLCHVTALPPGVECDPREMQSSCLLGCLNCWNTYGVEVYDMAACCRRCRLTNAYLIDNGPSSCSIEHVRSSWLKRFG